MNRQEAKNTKKEEKKIGNLNREVPVAIVEISDTILSTRFFFQLRSNE